MSIEVRARPEPRSEKPVLRLEEGVERGAKDIRDLQAPPGFNDVDGAGRVASAGAPATVAIGDGMARILIVDNEPLITAMMEEWLSELGHVVVGPAHNLAMALELGESARRRRRRPVARQRKFLSAYRGLDRTRPAVCLGHGLRARLR
jgi:hypothetical protein